MQGSYCSLNVCKNAARRQVFFSHTLQKVPKEFRSFSKTLSSSPFQQVTLYHSHPCILHTPNQRCRFSTQQLVVMLHADNTNAFQMISYTNVEKDLDRNEHLNLNLEKKHLINCCLLLPKQEKQAAINEVNLFDWLW